MNQQEIQMFFQWCDQNLDTFEAVNCDESDHYYINDVFVGGFAGDRRQFFIKHNDELANALTQMDKEVNNDEYY